MSKIGGSSKIQRLLKESSLLCHAGKLTEAKKIYRDLIKLIPNHPEVLGNLGTLELQEGNTDTGVSYLTQALKTNPTEIKFIINLGNGLIDLKKFDEALTYYEAAEKINPNFLNNLYNKARALKYLGRIDEAILSLRKCLSIDSNNYLVLCDLAYLKNAHEDYQEAIDLYTKAININPKNFLAFYNRGIAFENARQGDIFVQKSPAATILDLAKAIKEIFNSNNEIKIIGTRHGEKLYETLCTREEMVKAEDMGEFYRIPSDNRDLNYAMYFSEGEQDAAKIEDYHSHNTERLDVEGVKKLISGLGLVRREIFGESVDEFLV